MRYRVKDSTIRSHNAALSPARPNPLVLKWITGLQPESTAVDFGCGKLRHLLLTQALPRYPRLKLIIASATISADLFINHFNKHLPKRAVRELRIGEDTKQRRQLTSVTKTEALPEKTLAADGSRGPDITRSWLLKPADNCELMEFDGKAFRVDPHFHEGAPLEYAFLDPQPKDRSNAERVETGLRKLAKDVHEEVAAKAVGLLRDMYLSAADLKAGKGLRVTQSVEPDGKPIDGRIVDITERRGDILGFLHGENPIVECCKAVRAAAAEDGFPCKVEALPLFTQLPQAEQDKALLERAPGVHDKLASRVVALFSNGATDVLAVHDNVGQFTVLKRLVEDLLAKRVKEVVLPVARQSAAADRHSTVTTLLAQPLASAPSWWSSIPDSPMRPTTMPFAK